MALSRKLTVDDNACNHFLQSSDCKAKVDSVTLPTGFVRSKLLVYPVIYDSVIATLTFDRFISLLLTYT